VNTLGGSRFGKRFEKITKGGKNGLTVGIRRVVVVVLLILVGLLVGALSCPLPLGGGRRRRLAENGGEFIY